MSRLFPARTRTKYAGALTALRHLLMTLGLATFGAMNGPVMADTNSLGPVQYPPPGSTAPIASVSSATTNVVASAVTPAPVTPAVSPPTPAADGDIHDIRGPIAIPYDWLWAAYVFLGLIVAGLIYLAWRFFRTRFKAKEKQPFEIALEKLEAARALLAVDTVREYAFAVSEIIRVYIEQRFGEKAARRTTEEFLSDLLAQTGTALTQHRGLLEDFLNHCDLIKFARWGATERELESMHESARAFILDTRPRPEPMAKAPVPSQPELVQAK